MFVGSLEAVVGGGELVRRWRGRVAGAVLHGQAYHGVQLEVLHCEGDIGGRRLAVGIGGGLREGEVLEGGVRTVLRRSRVREDRSW